MWVVVAAAGPPLSLHIFQLIPGVIQQKGLCTVLVSQFLHASQSALYCISAAFAVQGLGYMDIWIEVLLPQ